LTRIGCARRDRCRLAHIAVVVRLHPRHHDGHFFRRLVNARRSDRRRGRRAWRDDGHGHGASNEHRSSRDICPALRKGASPVGAAVRKRGLAGRRQRGLSLRRRSQPDRTRSRRDNRISQDFHFAGTLPFGDDGWRERRLPQQRADHIERFRPALTSHRPADPSANGGVRIAIANRTG